MRQVFLGLWLASAVALFSCQKEISDTGSPVPEPGGKFLSKVTRTLPDRTFIDSFEYDAQNRCTKYVELYYTVSQGPNNPYIYFYDFHYNGTQTLPYKITDTSQGREMIWLIEYDAQQRKIVDSIVYLTTDEKQVSYYTYTANRIVANTVYSVSGVPVSFIKDTFDYDGNNCTRFAGVVQQQSTVFMWQYAMTYDTHINPFSKMNISNAVLFGANNILGDFTGLNKNNYLTETYSSPDPTTTPRTTSYQYTYDADGYPLSSTFQDATDPSRFGSEKYEYKK